MLKRLATAYAFSARRREVADDLPERDWLPLILRCRELRDRAHRPILELLNDIPRHAGMNADQCAIFQEALHASLRAGQTLLLVDGLDEISDEGARQTFANHLRTFLAMFPQAALVVTSREAGFRLVAGVIASTCQQAKLAPLDQEDALNLCERWHVEVVGATDKVRADARKLGQDIWDNERIRQLAQNPLLLTTLLVVKRWVGELPRGRAALYREAIRVLVRTWNIEGFAPLDEDETLAQLSYVACTMMAEGRQQIGQKALLKLLQNARRELEAELQFARISPGEFIERIEYRSSLLMQTGHELIDDVLQPVYEFRHLTFQEYLAARGYVEEQYPGRNSGRSLADILEPHFEVERWREVIPLAAVVAGRKAEELMKRLTAVCKQFSLEAIKERQQGQMRYRGASRIPLRLLNQCIRDEVQVTAPTLHASLHELALGYLNLHENDDEIIAILQGKFGPIFQELIEQAYLESGNVFEVYSYPLAVVAIHLYFGDVPRSMSGAIAASLRSALEGTDRLQKIRAALVYMRLAFEMREAKPTRELQAHFQIALPWLSEMLNADDLPCAVAASWVLAWIGNCRLLTTPPEPKMVLSLYQLWFQIGTISQARFPAWALSAQPLLSCPAIPSAGILGETVILFFAKQ